MRFVTDWLVYLLVRVFVCIVQALSLEMCHSISKFLAVIACDAARIRRHVIDENLKHAFPSLSPSQRLHLARDMWEHLFLMVCEIAHTPRKLRVTTWKQYIHIHRKRELVDLLLQPRPVVLVTGHFGNFELAGYIAGMYGFPCFTIARPLDNPFLDRYVKKFREAKGQFMLPKEGSAAVVQSVLDSNGLFSFLADQHAGPKGCWVEFFGRPASCHKAIALFPLLHGAPLALAYARRTGGPYEYELGLYGVADPQNLDESLEGVKPITAWYNQLLEELIRSNPEQYWWLHRRWKGSPDQRRRRKRNPQRQAA